VSESHCRVLWIDQLAVAVLPAEVDISIADAVRDELLAAVNQGPTALIADMSKTTFCDSAGVRALVRTFRRATESGTKMRLVVTTPPVERVLQITGVDRLIETYPNVAAALGSSSNGDGG
jgi:anti-sigma B factor antagonist